MTPTTDDAPVRCAFMPDWSMGVSLTSSFLTSVSISRKGLEQRIRRRVKPIYQLEYTRTGLTPEEARNRLREVQAEFRGPLTVPMWTDGIGLQAGMVSATSALLESNPIDEEWLAPFDVYLWHPTAGEEWRTCTEVDGRNLTFSGTGTLFPVGTLVFPSRAMLREASEGAMRIVDVESGEEIHRYRTL